MAQVAFIGLGRMGHGMAGRYLDAGFTVAVWNRNKAKAEDLIARGARWATSPEDAAIDAEAVVTMVADDEASRAVWLTRDGAAASRDSAASAHSRDPSFTLTPSLQLGCKPRVRVRLNVKLIPGRCASGACA